MKRLVLQLSLYAMRILLFLLILASFTAHGQTQGCLVGSRWDAPDSTTVKLIRNGDQQPVGEAKIIGGEFRINLPPSEPTLYFLVIGNQTRPIELFLEPKWVVVQPVKGDSTECTVNGSPSHLEFRSFVKRFVPLVQQNNQLANSVNQATDPLKRDSLLKQYQFGQQGIQAAIDSTIDAIPHSPVAPFILSATYGFNQDIQILETRFNKLDTALQKSQTGKQIAAMIADAKLGSVGSEAMDFTQDDVDGKAVSLSSFRGKYVLVDFWASWCGPCRNENPNVVENYNRFKDKNFTVLGVSLDRQGQKDRWLQAIAEDKLTWTHVSDLQFWNNAVAKQYKIQSIPQNLLVDPNGIIIAKNLRGEALGQKLCEILGCN